jgi:hypothetical protein
MTHTIAHLKEMLKKKGVKGYSGKTKSQLEAMCHEHKCFFIQEVVSSPSFRKGALSKKAKSHGMMALEFARDVLAHPEKHDLRTRRQAQFAINLSKRA